MKPLERLERDSFKQARVNQGSHIPRGLKKRIRKILTGTSVPLACLLMGDPKLSGLQGHSDPG
jgi:hypothetical protein